ncbi:hypothetical protein DFH07DRAFT_750148 [Mycena maculata]|uniref:Chromo domain-containing protein n=1 Tax=Mycena maculata TaxID=230809 RepID=A0AAD7IGQ8_9AGAR|nr:hypothetical protein DFH07DRAFT_750148 [Mycena maculata]
MPAIRTDSSGTNRALHPRGSPDSVLSNAVTASSGSQSTQRRSRRFICDASTPESALTSLSPTPEPQIPTIVVCGRVLEPTVVFDTLWRWLVKRKNIDDKRRKGMPAPWTDDPILRKYKFCHAYRVLDRTSQFVVTDVIEKGSQDRTELLFRILLFNCFNRIETWKLLEDALGGKLTFAEYDIHKYDRILSRAIERKVSLYTAAYIKIAKRFEYDTNHMGHLQMLEVFMRDLPSVLEKPAFAANVYEQIAAYPGMAAFTSYQLMLSLSYSSLLNFAANDFVVPGPGASSGLAKMFGASLRHAADVVPDIETQVLRYMAEHQREHFARLGLDFSFLRDAAGKVLELSVADLEHAVCEVDKYARLAHPQIAGTSKSRTELRGQFCASPEGLPAMPALPRAWAHPARRTARVRLGPTVVDQRYCCVKITDERGAGREVEYLVWWFGYTKPTWEPRKTMLKDAPELVKDYAKTKKTTKTRH